MTYQSYNLIENTDGTIITGATIGNILGQDPKLVTLANNGGSTQTHALLLGSLANDAANPNSFPATDQHGASRPKNGDGFGTALPDIGAFERDSALKTLFDFDGDGKVDVSVYRLSNGVWYLLQSTKGVAAMQFGISTDKPTVGDYDGDGKADQAVYRTETGTWYLFQSTKGFSSVQFGLSTDIPTPTDYDGDGKTDVAVFRPDSSTWYQMKSTQGFGAVQFGSNGDKPASNAFIR